MISLSTYSYPIGGYAPAVSHWMLDVGCWMFDVQSFTSSLSLFDDAEWKMGVGFLVGLIVFAAAIGAWRTLTGNDRTKTDVRIESDFVTHSELDTRLQGLASEIERKFEKALHGEFKQLNGERSRSIAGLHEKVEATTGELRRELSDRINIVDGLVRQIQGELKHFFRNAGGRAE